MAEDRQFDLTERRCPTDFEKGIINAIILIYELNSGRDFKELPRDEKILKEASKLAVYLRKGYFPKRFRNKKIQDNLEKIYSCF